MTVCKRGPEDLLHFNDATGVLLWVRSLPRGQWVERVPLSLGQLWHRVGIHLNCVPHSHSQPHASTAPDACHGRERLICA